MDHGLKKIENLLYNAGMKILYIPVFYKQL